MEPSAEDKKKIDEALRNLKELSPEEIERLADEGRAAREQLQKELDEAHRLPKGWRDIIITTPTAL